MTVVIALPLLVALVAMRDPAWFPHGDLAQIEMRVRDVATAHQPLVGVGGRMQAEGHRASHPGPLGYIALRPFYSLFGSDGFALQVASAGLNVLAIALTLFLAQRRGRLPLMIAVATALALLMRGYGGVVLLQPWLPHTPVLWWIVFLLAAWSALCNDLKMLPIAAFAVSLGMQSHVSYFLVGSGLCAFTIGGLWFTLLSRRLEAGFQLQRRRLVTWTTASAGLAFLLWLPPLVDETRNDPGNLSLLLKSFRQPYDEHIAFGDAVELFFAHLDVSELLTAERTIDGSPWPGVLLLAIWAAAASTAVRLRAAEQIRLHALLAAATVLGFLTMTRILGPAWNYLMLWAWGTTALIVLATAWTLVTAIATRQPLRPAVASFAVTGLMITALSAVDARHVEMPNIHMSETVRRLTPQVVDALAQDPAHCGDSCRYLVASVDPIGIGAEELGLLLALERQGLAVYSQRAASIVTEHRTIEPEDANATIHLAVGEVAIAKALDDSRFHQVAEVGPKAGQLAAYRNMRSRITWHLAAKGLGWLAAAVSTQEVIRPEPERMPDDVLDLVVKANKFERPRAVFLVSPASATGAQFG